MQKQTTESDFARAVRQTVEKIDRVLSSGIVQIPLNTFGDMYILLSGKPITEFILLQLSLHYGYDITRYIHKPTFQQTLEANKQWLQLI